MKRMKRQLIKLLSIHGVSSDETRVRDYLKPILTEMMDNVEVDAYGNLLATKKFGSGVGATVLLSAHMDTVRGVYSDRKIIESDGVLTSDKGALGADDRAGIAVILEVLRNIGDIKSFEGTVKVAFSREEEIGCIGSSKIDVKWYEDVDLAIVVDRRGNRDIVVGCYDAFCSDAVGDFFEEASKMQGMDWKACKGGISDACTFSENGINSVNLSVGYENEHTEREFVVLEDMKDTVKLILQSFAIINTFYLTFGNVPASNKWIKAYNAQYYGKSSYNSNYSNYYYYEDSFGKMSEEDLYAETYDVRSGETYILEVGEDIIIQQGTQEIFLTKKAFRELISQIEKVL